MRSRFDAEASAGEVLVGQSFSSLTNALREEPECLDGTRLIKPEALAALPRAGFADFEPLVRWWRKGRAWGVASNSRSAVEAYNLGRRLQKGLVARRALTAADPYMHDLTLYVAYSDGVVKIGPDEAHKPKTRDTTKQDARARLQRKGEGVFGSRGFSLGGHEGAYTMTLIPCAKEWRGKFAATTARGATWEELDGKLDQALARLGVG